MYSYTPRREVRKRNPTYLGMTGAQISILASMALALVCVCAVGVWLYVSVSAPPSSEVKPPTAIAQANATQVPTDASTPTLTPPPSPTPTPLPSPTPIPGWKKLEGGGAAIWLPESYIGGNPSTDKQAILQQIEGLGADFEMDEGYWEVQLFGAATNAIWAIDSNMGNTYVYTIVRIMSEPVRDLDYSLDSLLTEISNGLPTDNYVVDRRTLILDQREVGRLFVEHPLIVDEIRVEVKFALYALQSGSNIWLLGFTTGKEVFDDRMPVFEMSVRTFIANP